MPCDYCPTTSHPGSWHSVSSVTGKKRFVAVICPPCSDAAFNLLDVRGRRREEKAVKRSLLQLAVESADRSARLAQRADELSRV